MTSSDCRNGWHDWAPVGYEMVPGYPNYESAPGPALRILPPTDPRTFVIRACRWCPKVWVQEFDFQQSMQQPSPLEEPRP